MKKTNDLKKQLTSYSMVACAVMGVAPTANAELVGYDVDPDSTWFNPQDTGWYAININNVGEHCNSAPEFSFGASVGTTGTDLGQGFILYGYESNKVAGEFLQYTSSSSGQTSWTYNFPIVNSSGSSINASFAMTANESPIEGDIAWNSGSHWLVWGYDGDPSNSWGKWGGSTDKYLGLKFVTWGDSTISVMSNLAGDGDSLMVDTVVVSNAAGDGDSLTFNNVVVNDTTWETTEFYGWILMDVGIDGWDYTVKAWAYNDTPGAGAVCDITAVEFAPTNLCETVSIEADKHLESRVAIYSHERNVNVTLTGIDNTKGTASVINAAGQIVQTEPIIGSTTRFAINGSPAGLYIIKVDVNGGSKTQKVYIQ
ncbi:MAG: T9SS type A sorting domain-containing protein [Flavobacteriales bacterium]|nr:T9SS type A sorting domain-containing protein [Flavobacteriales bacterium]